jgi:hypothetical protein
VVAATESPPAAPAATAAPAEPAAPPEKRSLKLQFQRFTERFGHLMSRIVLTVLYVALVAPAGLVLALLADPLRIKRWRGSSWSPWTQDNDSLARARRQD